MRCHYEVFELERSASLEDIKKQYRKLALKYHPDRNHGDEEAAAEKFKEVSTAYAVLSDPQERKWYDDHRESILRGSDGTKGSGQDNGGVDLWSFFTRSCFDSFDDSPNGFYTVYRDVFQDIFEAELDASEELGVDSILDAPTFGDASTCHPDVLKFYGHWSNFVTCQSFAWEDKYNPSEAPNRQVKRAIEKENKKFRDLARREYVDRVRTLATFVRKRDPRIAEIEAEIKRKKAEEDEVRATRKAAEQQQRKDAREHRLQQLRENSDEIAQRAAERSRAFLLADHDSESDGKNGDDTGDHFDESGALLGDDDDKRGGDDIDGTDDGSEEVVSILRCEICRKDFKSESQMDQHLVSKLHKKKATEFEKKSKKKTKSSGPGPSKVKVEVGVKATAMREKESEAADIEAESDTSSDNISGSKHATVKVVDSMPTTQKQPSGSAATSTTAKGYNSSDSDSSDFEDGDLWARPLQSTAKSVAKKVHTVTSPEKTFTSNGDSNSDSDSDSDSDEYSDSSVQVAQLKKDKSSKQKLAVSMVEDDDDDSVTENKARHMVGKGKKWEVDREESPVEKLSAKFTGAASISESVSSSTDEGESRSALLSNSNENGENDNSRSSRVTVGGGAEVDDFLGVGHVVQSIVPGGPQQGIGGDYLCRECGWCGPSRNSLFKHLDSTGHATTFDIQGALPPSMTRAAQRGSKPGQSEFDYDDPSSAGTKRAGSKKKKKGSKEK